MFPSPLWFCYLLCLLDPVTHKKRYRLSSVTQSCPTLWDPMNHSTPGLLSITNSQSPPKPRSIESVMPSSHLILCRPLLQPSIFPSLTVVSKESGGQRIGVSASILPKMKQRKVMFEILPQPLARGRPRLCLLPAPTFHPRRAGCALLW